MVKGNIYPSRTPEFTQGDRKHLPFQSIRVHPGGQETSTLPEHQSSLRESGKSTLPEHQSSPRGTGNIYPSRAPEFTQGDRKHLPFQNTRVHPRGQETSTLPEHQSSPRVLMVSELLFCSFLCLFMLIIACL